MVMKTLTEILLGILPNVINSKVSREGVRNPQTKRIVSAESSIQKRLWVFGE